MIALCAAICGLAPACGAETYVANRDAAAGGSIIDAPSLGSGGSITGSGGEFIPSGSGGAGGSPSPGDDAGGSGGTPGSGGIGGSGGSGGVPDAGAGGTPGTDVRMDVGGNDTGPRDIGGNDVVDVRPVVRTAALSAGTATAIGGNPTGGTAYQDACPSGQAVVGFSGTATVAMPPVTAVVRQVATRCGVIQISGTTVTVTPGAMLPTRGMMAADPWTRTCPANQVIVGVTGRSGSFVDQLVFSCAPLTAASDAPGTALTPGTAAALAPIGGAGGMPFAQINCPAGRIATGSTLRTGDFLDGVALSCSSATVAP